METERVTESEDGRRWTVYLSSKSRSKTSRVAALLERTAASGRGQRRNTELRCEAALTEDGLLSLLGGARLLRAVSPSASASETVLLELAVDSFIELRVGRAEDWPARFMRERVRGLGAPVTCSINTHQQTGIPPRMAAGSETWTDDLLDAKRRSWPPWM